MPFDRSCAQQYEKWFETPEGRFAFEQERRLLRKMVAPWTRRGSRLLEIGCGTGLFLEDLWEAGFDVTGIDPSPAMLNSARKRLEHRAELHLGHAEHLPFGDKEFDYAMLMTTLEFCEDPAEAVREAVRVACRGVLVGFLNRYSLYYLTRGVNWPWRDSSGLLVQANWKSWLQVLRLLADAAGARPYKARSVLPGPTSTWRNGFPWGVVNGLIYPAIPGALTFVRYDLVDEKPLTPLMLFKAEPSTGETA